MNERVDATFDTSFWVHSVRVGLLPYVLDRLTLHVTPAVDGELPTTNPGGREFRRLLNLGVIREVRPSSPLVQEYGAGEREAITVALEWPQWTLLIDDYRPYLASANRGIRVLCSPLLAVTLYDDGVLTEGQLADVLARLAATGTVSPHLIEMARLRGG